jgi:hypothetical protein
MHRVSRIDARAIFSILRLWGVCNNTADAVGGRVCLRDARRCDMCPKCIRTLHLHGESIYSHEIRLS